MARRNPTLQLDEDVIRRAKILAAKRGTSVGGLVARELEELVDQDARYEEAWRRATEIMRQSAPLRGRARKFDPPMRRAAAREIVALYGEWPAVRPDVALLLAASKLEERHAFSFRDALVVEAARRGGATRLLTEACGLTPDRRDPHREPVRLTFGSSLAPQ